MDNRLIGFSSLNFSSIPLSTSYPSFPLFGSQFRASILFLFSLLPSIPVLWERPDTRSYAWTPIFYCCVNHSLSNGSIWRIVFKRIYHLVASHPIVSNSIWPSSSLPSSTLFSLSLSQSVVLFRIFLSLLPSAMGSKVVAVETKRPEMAE